MAIRCRDIKLRYQLCIPTMNNFSNYVIVKSYGGIIPSFVHFSHGVQRLIPDREKKKSSIHCLSGKVENVWLVLPGAIVGELEIIIPPFYLEVQIRPRNYTLVVSEYAV